MGGMARHRRALMGVVLAAGLLVLLPGRAMAAGGPSLSGAEAAALAREAATDDGALRELRDVTEVDGHPVDLDRATADLGPDRAERLDALAAALAPGRTSPMVGPDPNAARASAQQVLSDRKFQERDVPKPFKGALEWLADRLRPIGRFFDRVFSPILDLPGGAAILGTALVGLAAGATAWLASRRSRAAVAREHGSVLVDASLDPEALEHRADLSEAQGDLNDAVRLRYQAGLIRLVRANRLVLRADTTAEDAAAQIALPAMDQLTRDFEEVVYGDRAASADDLSRTREGWLEVLAVRSHR